ncbi:MAG: Hsp70 family protein, partial [Nitrospirae bacterium]|nr:Hsp70 family protein [Nitrospirota bacterium]
TASSGLTEEEIKRMVKDADTHAEEDRKKKELAEVRNEADNLIYSVEKSLREFGEKIAEDEKSRIQGAIDRTRKALEGSEVQAIKDAVQELSTASHKLAEEMYRKASASQESAGAAGPSEEKPKGEADVVDADFEEVDKDKK